MLASNLDLRQELDSLEVSMSVLKRHADEIRQRMRLDILAQDEKFAARKTRKLAQSFSELGYRILSCRSKEDRTPSDRAALLIWKIGDAAKDFVKKLGYCPEEECAYSLEGLEDSVKNSLYQLGEAFARLGWISCRREQNLLKVVILGVKEARTFWRSEWAEIVNRWKVVVALESVSKKHHFKYDVFYDLKLAKYDKPTSCPDMQLDVVVQLSDRLFVFETKTGFELGIDKWIDRARMFGADGKSAFITCYSGEDIPAKIFKPYRMFRFKDLENSLRSLLYSSLRDGK